MNLPRIGITMDRGQRPDRYALAQDYAIAVEKAGGLPLPIPFHLTSDAREHLLGLLDGLLFTGGDDMDPVRFHQSRHPQSQPVDPDREAFEFALIESAERHGLPILGICLGCQVLNVHRGGSLIQFLPEQARDNPLEHRRLDLPMRRHPVTLAGDSQLAVRLGHAELDVNTSHKQAVDRPGRGLEVIARAPDGVIEGVQDTSGPLYLGIQWHPEQLWSEPDHLAIFHLLVDAARQPANR